MQVEFRVRSVVAKATWLDLPVVATRDLASIEEIEAVAKEVAGAVEASTGIASATVRWAKLATYGSECGHGFVHILPSPFAKPLRDMADKVAAAAYKKYHARFDNTLYLAAVGDNHLRGISLGDTALALCGHPNCKVDLSFEGDAAAIAFLAKFM